MNDPVRANRPELAHERLTHACIQNGNGSWARSRLTDRRASSTVTRMARLVEVQGSTEGKVKRQTMHERSSLGILLHPAVLHACEFGTCTQVRTYVVATSHLVLRKRIHEMKLLHQRFRLTIFVCLIFPASNARNSGTLLSLSTCTLFQLEVGSPPPPQLLPRQLASNRKLQMG